MALGKVTEFAEVGRCRGQGAGALGVSPSLRRARLADRAGQLRERRGWHRTGPHRAGTRNRGLPDRPNVSAFGAQPGGSSGKFTDEAPEWIVGQQVFAANPRIIEHLKQSGHLFHELELVAQLSPLLAVQEAGDLPGHRAVVHRRRSQRPPRPDAQGHPGCDLASLVGPVAHRGHGLAPSRLVHQPAAVVGRAHPRARLHDLPYAAS